jgi:antitoxin component of RelBE/YafQ-DinJ toxin-antitoxin module
MSTAFNVFARKVIDVKGMPFEVRTENGFTPAQEAEMIKEAEYAIKHARGFTSAKELHDNILGR